MARGLSPYIVVGIFYLAVTLSMYAVPTPPGIEALEAGDKVVYWSEGARVYSLPAGFQVELGSEGWRIVGPTPKAACSDESNVWVAAERGGLSSLYRLSSEGVGARVDVPGSVSSIACGPGWALIGVVQRGQLSLVYWPSDSPPSIAEAIVGVEGWRGEARLAPTIWGVKTAVASDVAVVLEDGVLRVYRVPGSDVKGAIFWKGSLVLFGSIGGRGFIAGVDREGLEFSLGAQEVKVDAVYPAGRGSLVAVVIPEGRLPFIVEVLLDPPRLLGSYRVYPSAPMIYNGSASLEGGAYMYMTLIDIGYVALKVYRPGYAVIPGGNYSIALVAPSRGIQAFQSSIDVVVHEYEASWSILDVKKPLTLTPLTIEEKITRPGVPRLQALFTAAVLLAPWAVLIALSLSETLEGAFAVGANKRGVDNDRG